MAQSDVHLISDQKVAGLIPAGSGNFLFIETDHETFSMVILSSGF